MSSVRGFYTAHAQDACETSLESSLRAHGAHCTSVLERPPGAPWTLYIVALGSLFRAFWLGLVRRQISQWEGRLASVSYHSYLWRHSGINPIMSERLAASFWYSVTESLAWLWLWWWLIRLSSTERLSICARSLMPEWTFLQSPLRSRIVNISERIRVGAH